MRIKRILLLLINILIPVLMTFITAFCGIFLIKYFMPFIIAWIIAMAANPVVKFLEGRIKIHRKHGSILIIVFVLCLIIGILYLIVSSAFMLLGRFINLLPRWPLALMSRWAQPKWWPPLPRSLLRPLPSGRLIWKGSGSARPSCWRSPNCQTASSFSRLLQLPSSRQASHYPP